MFKHTFKGNCLKKNCGRVVTVYNQ